MASTFCTGCTPTSSPTAQASVGWVLESSGRGTLGLIFSCVTTIFLCTWVVIHARVCKCTFLHRLHKIILLLKTIIAPEFIAVEGLQEWSQAQRMVKNCAEPTTGGLKLVHAFYIGMLALRYRTPCGERVIWPNQYTWLLEQGLIKWDDHALWGISEQNIRDKSNANGTVKLIALGQVVWFVAQSIMRWAHRLPLSQLETMTLSYIPLFAVTYFFWWIKPKDIMTPSLVELPEMLSEQKTTFEAMAVSSAFDDEGIGKQNSLWTIWYLTPRVFEKEAEDKELQKAHQKQSKNAKRATQEDQVKAASLNSERQARSCDWDIGEDLLEKGSACLLKAGKPYAKDIVVAYWDPELYHSKILWPVICLFGVSFGALHLLSWNTVFPTHVEQWLWRGAALASIFSMLIFMQFEKVVFRWGGPLTMISLLSPVLYLFSRLVMMAGVIASFRASDPAVYATYDVSTYWIHIL